MADLKILLVFTCAFFAYQLDATVAPSHTTKNVHTVKPATTRTTAHAAGQTTQPTTTRRHGHVHHTRPTKEPNEVFSMETRFDHTSNLMMVKIGKTCYVYHLYGDDIHDVHTKDGIRNLEIRLLQKIAVKPTASFLRDDLQLMSPQFDRYCPQNRNFTLIKLD